MIHFHNCNLVSKKIDKSSSVYQLDDIHVFKLLTYGVLSDSPPQGVLRLRMAMWPPFATNNNNFVIYKIQMNDVRVLSHK